MFTRIGDLNKMFEKIGSLRGHFDTFFDDFDRAFSYGVEDGKMVTYPRTNLYDKGDHYELIAELPGLSKDDITLKILGNYLEISGTRKINAPEGYKVHRNERHPRNFTKSLTLPMEIETSKASATLNDGFLILILPKPEEAQACTISIS